MVRQAASRGLSFWLAMVCVATLRPVAEMIMLMSRIRANRSRVLMALVIGISTAAAPSLLPDAAYAAPIKKKPARWHGYGFLPGYHQPPNNNLPPYMQEGALRRVARGNKRPWYIDPTPQYYGWDGDWHYFGRPGFYRGQYNGGSFGPCYTRTPIGPIWNCG